jgi:hypothetical protein
VGSVVEWRGGERRRHVASVRRTKAEEVMRWEPVDISRRSCDAQERRGQGGLGLNPNTMPLIPHARGHRTRPGRSTGPDGPW